MNPDHNKILARRVVEEVWSQRKLSLVRELYAPEFVNHQHSHPNVRDIRGISALTGFVREFREGLPGFPRHD